MLKDNQQSRWFVVQTKPRQEDVAYENLVRQKFTTYLPKIQLRKKSRSTWKLVIEPLFKNYLFILFNPQTTDISSLRSTRGVNRLVQFGQQLQPVPEEFVENLRKHEDDQLKARKGILEVFKPGDKVEVTEGPFLGLQGIYQMNSSEQRVFVLMDFLGKQSKISIDRDHLAPI